MLSSRRTIDSIFMQTCRYRLECRGRATFWLRPVPELEDPIALCIDLKAEDGQFAREGLFKTFAIHGLDFEYTVLIGG